MDIFQYGIMRFYVLEYEYGTRICKPDRSGCDRRKRIKYARWSGNSECRYHKDSKWNPDYSAGFGCRGGCEWHHVVPDQLQRPGGVCYIKLYFHDRAAIRCGYTYAVIGSSDSGPYGCANGDAAIGGADVGSAATEGQSLPDADNV